MKRDRFTPVAILIVLAVAGGAQAAGYRAPRTASGQPDLQGIWSLVSLTDLERPRELPTRAVTEAQAKAYEAKQDGTPGIPNDAVGQNEAEWWEIGAKLGRLDGHPVSSWLIDPADGRLPYSPVGLKALRGAQRAMGASFDGPEVRPAPERCVTGSSSATGAPMLNGAYSSLIQIVQTAADVVIVAEMNHDARIISLRDAAPPPVARDWSGLSVGRWEGDTLVVVTTNFHPQAGWRAPSGLYLSPNARVTERFTRTGKDEIRYAYTVEDPSVFTQVWRAEMPIQRSVKPMFEYACHEGNYSLGGVLAGARETERAAKAAAR